MSDMGTTSILNAMVERVTKAQKIINTDHAFIHEGIAFKAHLDIGTLAPLASESYSFKTPVGKYLHFKNARLVGIGATVRLDIIRGTVASPLTIDSPGAAATELIGPSNVNDVSTVASGVLVKKTPTYTGGASGAVWDYVLVPGDSTNQMASVAESKTGDNFELVMKPDTYYVFKFTNINAADTATFVDFDAF